MSTTAHAATVLATEIAWNGSASDEWIADIVTRLGLDADAAAVTAYAVEAGLLRPIPRLGGYTVSRKVNADVFGSKFAEWWSA